MNKRFLFITVAVGVVISVEIFELLSLLQHLLSSSLSSQIQIPTIEADAPDLQMTEKAGVALLELIAKYREEVNRKHEASQKKNEELEEEFSKLNGRHEAIGRRKNMELEVEPAKLKMNKEPNDELSGASNLRAPLEGGDHYHTGGSTSDLTKTQQMSAEIVVCTHVSVNKLDRVKLLQDAWKGPMSVAVWVTNQGELAAYQQFVSTYHQTTTHGNNITKFSMHHEESPLSTKRFYPHNILRNLAIKHSTSDYILPLDVDFLPPPHAYEGIQNLLQKQDFQESLQDKICFVLPIFALQKGVVITPASRQELLEMYQNQTAKQWHYAPGHDSSNYNKWLNGRHQEHNNKHFLSYYSYPIKPEVEYEPYFVAYRTDLPKYFEKFRGFALNKKSLTNELVLAGYKFQVLWDYWLVHLWHDTKAKANDIRKGSEGRNFEFWKSHFQPYLQSKYEVKEPKWLYPRVGFQWKQ